MRPSRVIILASARSDGNTAAIAEYLCAQLTAPIIDLSTRSIAPFSYDNDYPAADDFLRTFQELLPYDEWFFLTPVYWYTMSAQLKVFLDRFSDVLRYHQEWVPGLAGKSMWPICCSSDAELIPHFFTPFQLTAAYLDMIYRGELHTWGGRQLVLKPAVKATIDSFLHEHDLYGN